MKSPLLLSHTWVLWEWTQGISSALSRSSFIQSKPTYFLSLTYSLSLNMNPSPHQISLQALRIEIPEKISDHLPFKGYTSWQHLLYQECLTNLCRISYKTVRSLGKKHGLISSVILIHLTSSLISRSAQVYGWNR